MLGGPTWGSSSNICLCLFSARQMAFHWLLNFLSKPLLSLATPAKFESILALNYNLFGTGAPFKQNSAWPLRCPQQKQGVDIFCSQARFRQAVWHVYTCPLRSAYMAMSFFKIGVPY